MGYLSLQALRQHLRIRPRLAVVSAPRRIEFALVKLKADAPRIDDLSPSCAACKVSARTRDRVLIAIGAQMRSNNRRSRACVAPASTMGCPPFEVLDARLRQTACSKQAV